MTPVLAWKCSALAGYPEIPDPCIVYAQRRSQAIKVAFHHALGFDQTDWASIRCRRAPEHDGEQPPGVSIGMYDENGVWRHESFKHYGA